MDATGTAVLVVNNLRGGTNNPSVSDSGDSVLNPSQAGPVQVPVTDYLVQLIPSNTGVRGQSGSAVLHLVPMGGFNLPVQLACSSLPAGVSCRFSKSSVTLDGVNPVPITVTLSNRGYSASLASNRNSKSWGVTAAFSLGGLMLQNVLISREGQGMQTLPAVSSSGIVG